MLLFILKHNFCIDNIIKCDIMNHNNSLLFFLLNKRYYKGSENNADKLLKPKQINTHAMISLCLKVSDIAAVMSISPVTAYNLVKQKGFPRIKLGRRIDQKRSSSTCYITKHKQHYNKKDLRRRKC